MQRLIHRKTDLMARYGGEEFRVVLFTLFDLLPGHDPVGRTRSGEQLLIVSRPCREPYFRIRADWAIG